MLGPPRIPFFSHIIQNPQALGLEPGACGRSFTCPKNYRPSGKRRKSGGGPCRSRDNTDSTDTDKRRRTDGNSENR